MEKRRNEREWKEKRPGGRNGEERKGRKPFHTAREEREMDREIKKPAGRQKCHSGSA